jgi:serine/threonine-protein kinase RsbT
MNSLDRTTQLNSGSSETLPIQNQSDIVVVRHKVRSRAAELKFSLIEQTKVVTAASELARNTLEYGGGGEVLVEILEQNFRKGLRLTFVDQGPGIADLNLALTDGYTSGNGLGMGLSGSRRLMDEFQIESQVGRGTRVSIAKWK